VLVIYRDGLPVCRQLVTDPISKHLIATTDQTLNPRPIDHEYDSLPLHHQVRSYIVVCRQLTASASAEITLPRVVSDLLMFAPSLSRVPLAPDESARSLPAKSTRLTLLTYKCTKLAVNSALKLPFSMWYVCIEPLCSTTSKQLNRPHSTGTGTTVFAAFGSSRAA